MTYPSMVRDLLARADGPMTVREIGIRLGIRHAQAASAVRALTVKGIAAPVGEAPAIRQGEPTRRMTARTYALTGAEDAPRRTSVHWEAETMLRARGPMTVRELASAIGRSYPGVREVLVAMESRGLVVRTGGRPGLWSVVA